MVKRAKRHQRNWDDDKATVLEYLFKETGQNPGPNFHFSEKIQIMNSSIHLQTEEKQTKNRNETGSDLSLGERLMRLSKRLSRKRCCDTTPVFFFFT